MGHPGGGLRVVLSHPLRRFALQWMGHPAPGLAEEVVFIAPLAGRGVGGDCYPGLRPGLFSWRPLRGAVCGRVEAGGVPGPKTRDLGHPGLFRSEVSLSSGI